jgi:hypothetical protein
MINYKDPAELRELMEKVTPGPWVAVQGQCWRVEPNIFNGCNEPWEGWYEEPCAEDAQFIALSREALPYWIQQAEAAERAVERLLDALDHGARCPQAGMWDECHDYGDRKCRACRKAWAMKEGK